MSYIGVPPFGQTVRTITELTASAGQTTFNVSGGYLPGYVDVFLNGVSLASGDFTSTNGSTVVLGAAASLNDEFKAIAYWPVSLIDTYRKSEADALLATKQAASNVLTTYASTGIGFRNRIINGAMTISQRGSVNVTFAGGDTYVATDRFSLTNYWGAGQVNTAQSSTAPTGFTNSLSLTVATPAPMSGSTGYAAALWQCIEGFNISDAYIGTVTLSFWVRSSITGTYSVTFSNVRSPSISSTSRLYVANYTINAANTWEQKTITLSLSAGVASGTWDTTNGTGLCVAWNLGAESNRKGNAFLDTWGTMGSTPNLQSSAQTNWISTSGATFFLSGVQLEAGSVATPFERRDYGRELIMCQRYFERTYPIQYPFISGAYYGTESYHHWYFKVEKRATPTWAFVGTWAVAPTTAWTSTTEVLLGSSSYFYGNTTSYGTASAEL